MMKRILDAVMDHFGIKDEQVEKVKTMIDMAEFKMENGKRVLVVKVGEGIEIKIVQPDKPATDNARRTQRSFHDLDQLFGEESDLIIGCNGQTLPEDVRKRADAMPFPVMASTPGRQTRGCAPPFSQR